MPQVCGVYVIYGPAGVYVGQAVDCYARNLQFTKLGIEWCIVRVLRTDASFSERMKAETEVADALEAAGQCVVSRNTTRVYSVERRGRASWNRGKKGWASPETRAKMSAIQSARSPEWQAKINAGRSAARRRQVCH